MEFTSGPDSQITVKLDGAEYQLRQPLVGDIRRLAKMGEMAGDKMLNETISFISDLGIPEEKLNSLSMKTLEQIFSFITSPKKN